MCLDGGTDTGVSVDYPTQYNGSTELTMFALVTYEGDVLQNLAYERAIFRGERPVAFGCFVSPTAIKIRPLISTTGTTAWTTAVDITLGPMVEGDQYLVFASYRSGSPIIGGHINLRTGAVSSGSSMTPSGGVSAYPASQGMRVGGASGTRAWTGHILTCGLDARYMSLDRAIALAQNPWALFRRRPLYVPLPDAAGATHEVSGDSVTEVGAATAGAVGQTHLVGGASASESGAAASGSIAQTHRVGAVSAVEAGAASASVVAQAHQATVASAVEAGAATGGSISVGSTHAVTAASASEAGQAAHGAIAQTHAIGAADLIEAGTLSVGTISLGSIHLVGAASVVEIGVATVGAIGQTNQVGGASATEYGAASAGSVSVPQYVAADSAVETGTATSGSISLAMPDAIVATISRRWASNVQTSARPSNIQR